jgi:3-phenylpropionate/trans-cinnamate dioxygenase ferredoxin subunit
MARHRVCAADDLPPDARRRVTIEGRAVLVLNAGGRLRAVSDMCPHKGASLSQGALSGLATAGPDGAIRYERPQSILRCPWHGWEFDVETGRSLCDPARMRLMTFAVAIEDGAVVVATPD